ncbi:MAG: hypothetical protein ACFFBQ_10905 [Promethearchaeota archaeon]
MAYCEKCGKQIEEGAVFCSTCTHGFDATSGIVTQDDMIKDSVEHEIFSFKPKHTRLSKVIRIIPIILSIFYIVVGLIGLFTELIPPEQIPTLLSVGIIILGFLIVYQLSRGSQQNYSIFISLMIVILTLGITIVFPEYINLILPIGTTAIGFIIVILLLWHSNRNRVLSLVLIIIIVSLGISIAFPDYTSIMLAMGCILSGLLTLFVKL